MFPFFYWIIIVRVKVGLWGNLFVLRFQKIRVFWLLWLLSDVSLSFIYFLVYLRIFFVIFVLMSISDLWLLLVYSSIANTGILLLRLLGDKYVFVVLLYLSVIVVIINCLLKSDRVIEIVVMVFFFMVIPPFVLFFIKFYIILRLDFSLKLGFFLVIFDVLVLIYYFRLVFMKFLLMDLGILTYMINFLLVGLVLLLSN